MITKIKQFVQKSSPRDIWGLILLVSLLGINYVLLRRSAFVGFSLYDFGSFLDASWRIFRGQRPYLDFFYTTGPVHLYMNAFFFVLFGFGKSALLAHLICVNSILIIATYFVTRLKMPFWLSILVTLLAASGFYWAHPHPWYTYSGHFWGILGYLILLWKLPFEDGKTAFRCSLACGVLAVLSLMSKSDVGAANGLVFFAVSALSQHRIRALSGYVAGALASLVFIFLFVSPVGFYQNAVTGYGLAKSNQILRLLFLPTWFKNFYWLPLMALPFASGPLKKPDRILVVLFIGIAFAGLFALNVGSLRDMTHIPLMSTYLATAFVILYRPLKANLARQDKILRWCVLAVMVFVTGLQIYRTINHNIILSKGAWATRGNFRQGEYPLQTGPFRGWRFEAKDGIALDGILQYINTKISKDESLLILTNLQILYALSGRNSYRDIPFLWDIGEAPAPGQQREEVRDTIMRDLPVWILTHKEEGRHPVNALITYLELSSEILNNYALVQRWGRYGLLRRKL